jgi:two-component system OmpR family sensor kinase
MIRNSEQRASHLPGAWAGSVRRHLRTLTARMVLSAVALVVAVTVVGGAITTLAVRSYLTAQLDDQVTSSLDRAQRSPPIGADAIPPLDTPDEADTGAGPDRRDGIGDRRGQGVGTLTAIWTDVTSPGVGDVIVQGRRGTTSRPSLSTNALAALDKLPADGQPRDIQLARIGDYRVAVRAVGDGKVAAGLPTEGVRDVVSNVIGWQAALIGLSAVVAVAGGLLLIRRQMKPLRQVAATAHDVASLPLAEGEIHLAQRVPDHLTDDYSEVGQVGAALNTLLAHVESSLSARHLSEQHVRQFVADASHELRTPLATIVGYSALAKRHPDDVSTLRAALAKVDEESRRMASLVEDLLLLARLDSGRPLGEAPVDLTRLLVEAVSDARVLGPEHQWKLVLPEEAVEVTGDEDRLHQVVTNLLTNARKYTPGGSTVTVYAHSRGFVVHDDGPGFPPDLISHAFERFARGDLARNRQGGAGLGLALVEAILSAHGGRVTLHSQPGNTKVEVELPDGIGSQ